MKVTQKGQVTIPKKFRDRFFLKTNTRVSFEEKEDGILIQLFSFFFLRDKVIQ